MQLNVATDYAIRIVLYLSSSERVVSSKELSQELGIPQNMVLKIARQLRVKDIIKNISGAQGGFILNQPPEKTRLLDVIALMESTIKINRCLEEDKYCSRHATENCPVRKTYCELQNLFEESLGKITFKDLLGKN